MNIYSVLNKHSIPLTLFVSDQLVVIMLRKVVKRKPPAIPVSPSYQIAPPAVSQLSRHEEIEIKFGNVYSRKRSATVSLSALDYLSKCKLHPRLDTLLKILRGQSLSACKHLVSEWDGKQIYPLGTHLDSTSNQQLVAFSQTDPVTSILLSKAVDEAPREVAGYYSQLQTHSDKNRNDLCIARIKTSTDIIATYTDIAADSTLTPLVGFYDKVIALTLRSGPSHTYKKNAFAQRQAVAFIKAVYSDMSLANIKPSTSILTTLIRGFSQYGHYAFCKQAWTQALAVIHPSLTHTRTTLSWTRHLSLHS